MTQASARRLLPRYAALAVGALLLIRIIPGPLCGDGRISALWILLVIAIVPLLASPALLAAIVAWRAVRYDLVGESRAAQLGVAVLLLVPLSLLVAANLFDVSVNCVDPERKPVLSLVAMLVAVLPVFVAYVVYWVRFRIAARPHP